MKYNKRSAPQTLHCSWCQRVRAGDGWVPERRRSRRECYTNGICVHCKSFYLGGFDLEEFLAWMRSQNV